jgi:hypothetical protein
LETSIDDRIKAYIDAASHVYFGRRIQKIFPQILDLGRRTLALKRYLAFLHKKSRGPAWLERQRTMTEEEHDEWKSSPAAAAQNAELAAIRRRFVAANPRATLSWGSQFRSLDKQIKKWEKSSSVAAPALKVLTLVRGKLSDRHAFPDLGNYIDPKTRLHTFIVAPSVSPVTLATGPSAGAIDPRLKAVREFANWLHKQHTPGTPTVATPGLSSHGIGEAIDFSIRTPDERTFNAKTSAAKWRADGWAEPLRVAVVAGGLFSGPLEQPDEPWHFTFHAPP